MALRLIEVVLQEKEAEEINDLLGESKILDIRQVKLPGEEVLVRILLDAEQSESVLDVLEKRYIKWGGKRMVVLPVEATLPRVVIDLGGKALVSEKSVEHIGREELYEDIKAVATCSRTYLAMVVLSTVVAAIGLQRNNVGIIIGAMVIAPLLGPNMAISLGIALGDLPLLWRAFRTSMIGIMLAIGLSLIIAMFMDFDLTLPEILSRTRVLLWDDVILALAAGAAGAISFTTGSVSGALIGVMVAVAMLPPLVTFGVLLGSNYPVMAMGAFSLFLVNLICVNLAGVMSFWIQGIRPVTWKEKGLAVKATRFAVGILVLCLLVLSGLIWFLQKGAS